MADIFNLERQMAPRLIKLLYIIAIVLVGLMTVRGVVRGVVTMVTPPPVAFARALPPPPGAGAPEDGAATAQSESPPPAPPAFQSGNGDNRAFAGRRFGPRMMNRQMGPGMMGQNMMRRRFGGPYAGAIRIGMALLTGLVLLMVLRVLAEIGLAIISLSNRMGTADSK